MYTDNNNTKINDMKTTTNLEKAKVTTVFNSNKVMTECVVENDNRIVTLSLGRNSGKWSIFLDSKENDFNRNLRTYTNKDWGFAVKYFDKKVKELNK